MLLSEKYPEMLESVEKKLKEAAEKKGLDFEEIRKDTAAGINFEVESYGILSFGTKYALKRTPVEPAVIVYSEIYWACKNPNDHMNRLVAVLLDGSQVGLLLEDKARPEDILKRISDANPDAMIGYSEEKHNKFKEYMKTLKTEEPPKKVAPDPVTKLPQEKINSIQKKIEQIIDLGRKLSELSKKWKLEIHDPIDVEELAKWCESNGVYLPDVYTMILARTNGFGISYDSIHYINIYHFDVNDTTKDMYQRTREEMLGREYDYYINCKPSLGWSNHQMLHYNPYTGELFIERERYKYDPVEDFEKEVLDVAIQYFETQERRLSQKDQTKDANKSNPMMKWYNKVLASLDDPELNSDAVLFEPVPKKEIAAWEKKNDIKLPKDYKNWLMLSNGLEFADKIVYKLEELDLENPVTGPKDGKEYIVIASLSGASDCLVFYPTTKEVFKLTDDGEMRTGDFVYHVIQEGFEYLKDE